VKEEVAMSFERIAAVRLHFPRGTKRRSARHRVPGRFATPGLVLVPMLLILSLVGNAAPVAGGQMALPMPMALQGDEAQMITVAHLAAGTLAEGESALETLLVEDDTNEQARLGLGVIRFLRAIERLSQGLYGYGLKSPESFMVPVVRLPVPPNPNPEPITYADFRALLETYVADLARAEETIAGVTSSDVKLVLDLSQIRYDVEGDGRVGADERLLAIIQRITGIPEAEMPASLTFAFDAGDARWLQGYSHVLMAIGEFLLAHDWQESFDVSFFHFFPGMESPFRDALVPPTGNSNDQISPVADLISFLHIRWPVVEPERMAAVREHLKATIALSRESWQAIVAERDDDREWIPNPEQTNRFADVLPVSPERIDAWYAVLDEAEAVLDGEKLVPHWRFSQGFNLRRVFEEPQPFDLVLWITGPATLPYLEDGPVATPEEWGRLTQAFEGNFGLFAVWVN
jgi:hypothetical protein